MKLIVCSVTCILLLILAIGSAPSQIPADVVGDTSLRSFLPRFEEGINRFINGDPALRLGGGPIQRKRSQGEN